MKKKSIKNFVKYFIAFVFQSSALHRLLLMFFLLIFLLLFGPALSAFGGSIPSLWKKLSFSCSFAFSSSIIGTSFRRSSKKIKCHSGKYFPFERTFHILLQKFILEYQAVVVVFERILASAVGHKMLEV